jgi:hypothetical protein
LIISVAEEDLTVDQAPQKDKKDQKDQIAPNRLTSDGTRTRNHLVKDAQETGEETRTMPEGAFPKKSIVYEA